VAKLIAGLDASGALNKKTPATWLRFNSACVSQ
jgi:hypothetical protein